MIINGYIEYGRADIGLLIILFTGMAGTTLIAFVSENLKRKAFEKERSASLNDTNSQVKLDTKDTSRKESTRTTNDTSHLSSKLIDDELEGDLNYQNP